MKVEELVAAGFVPTEYEGQKGIFYVKKCRLKELPIASKLINSWDMSGNLEVVTETIPADKHFPDGAVQMHIAGVDHLEGPFPLDSEQGQLLLQDAIAAKAKPVEPLTEYDKKILAVLDTVGGFETGDVAILVTPQFGSNKRQHSAAVRSWLLGLERRGLVRRLDDQKPVCWVKVVDDNLD